MPRTTLHEFLSDPDQILAFKHWRTLPQVIDVFNYADACLTATPLPYSAKAPKPYTLEFVASSPIFSVLNDLGHRFLQLNLAEPPGEFELMRMEKTQEAREAMLAYLLTGVVEHLPADRDYLTRVGFSQALNFIENIPKMAEATEQELLPSYNWQNSLSDLGYDVRSFSTQTPDNHKGELL